MSEHEPDGGGLGARVRRVRRARGLSLEDLARACGCGRSYLSQIENGRNAGQVSSRLLSKIEAALLLSEGELVGLSELSHAGASVRAELARERREREGAQAELARVSLRAGGAVGVSLDALYKSGALHALAGVSSGRPEASSPTSAPSVRGGVQIKASPTPAPLLWGGVQERGLEPVRLVGRVPIVNKVAAGLPREFDDMGYPARVADEYLAVGPGGDPDGFACRVVGASMEPLYREGDIVVFWPSRVVRHGSDCFVRLERDAQTTFKRVFFEPEPEAGCDDAEALAVWGERVERVRLVPLNERFEVRVVTREEVAAIFSAVSVTRALG